LIKFINFRFALFTPPPLGDFHPTAQWVPTVQNDSLF
jgi:hypothetical protein